MIHIFIYLCALAVAPLAAIATAADQKVFTLQEPKPHESNLQKVKHELVKAEIIPTVIDEFLPSLILDVEFLSNDAAALGNTLKVKNVQDEPTFLVVRPSEAESDLTASNLTYTITLTDPDAPSRDDPRWAEMCHFIATGITLSYSSGDPSVAAIMPWKAPGPPPKTGKHRYVFLLFAPANGTTDPLNLTKPDDRQHWGTGKERHGVRDWAADNGLEPVAANFFYAQNEKQ